MLKNANLPMPEGVVDEEIANGKSAEEMYVVFEEKKKSEKQNRMQGGQSGNSGSQNGQGNQGQNVESFDDLQKKNMMKRLWKNNIRVGVKQ